MKPLEVPARLAEPTRREAELVSTILNPWVPRVRETLGASKPSHAVLDGVRVERLRHPAPQINDSLYGIAVVDGSRLPIHLNGDELVVGAKGEIRNPTYAAMELTSRIPSFSRRLVDDPERALHAAYHLVVAPEPVEIAVQPVCLACTARPRTSRPAARFIRCTRCGTVERTDDDGQAWVEVYADERGNYFQGLYAGQGLSSAHGYEDYLEWTRVILGAEHFDRRVAQISRHTPLGARRMLDVGCAAGDLAAAFGRRGWHHHGVDLSAWCVAQAEATFPEGRWYRGTASDVDEELFDVVTMMDVFEHIPDPVGELSVLRRLLVAGGLLVLELPNQASLDAEVTGADYLFAEHLWFYTPSGIGRLLEHAGFDVVTVWTEDDHYFRVDQLLAADRAEKYRAELRGERLLVIARRRADT